MKWFLIYTYHDLFMREYGTKEELKKDLKQLLKDYKNDSDFHYKVIEGKIIYESN